MGTRQQRVANQSNRGTSKAPKQRSKDTRSPYPTAEMAQPSTDSPLVPDALPGDEESREWLLTTVRRVATEFGHEWGSPKAPTARIGKGGGWHVRDGRAQLGRQISIADVLSRDESAVRGIFDQARTLTVEFSTGQEMDAHPQTGLTEQETARVERLSLKWSPPLPEGDDGTFGLRRYGPQDEKTKKRRVVYDRSWVLHEIVRAVPQGQRDVVRDLLQNRQGEVNPVTYAGWAMHESLDKWELHPPECDHAEWTGVSGSMKGTASRQAASDFLSWQKTKSKTSRPPWPTRMSVPVGHEYYTLRKRGRDAFLDLKVQGEASDRRCPIVRVQVYPRGRGDWMTFWRIVSGEYDSRGGTLEWDVQERKWLFHIPYVMPRPKAVTTDGMMVIQSSLKSVVGAVLETGKYCRSDANALVHSLTAIEKSTEHAVNAPLIKPARPRKGRKTILQVKAEADAQKREMRSHYPFLGAGARGRGRQRRRHLYAAGSRKEANRVNTWQGQQAAYFAKLAAEEHRRIVIDESQALWRWHPDERLGKLIKRFPFCGLWNKLEWDCKKLGVPTQRVTNDRLCPECQGKLEIGRKPRVRLDGKPVDRLVCVCSKCSLEGPVDVILSWRSMQLASRSTEERMRIDELQRLHLEKLHKIETHKETEDDDCDI